MALRMLHRSTLNRRKPRTHSNPCLVVHRPISQISSPPSTRLHSSSSWVQWPKVLRPLHITKKILYRYIQVSPKVWLPCWAILPLSNCRRTDISFQQAPSNRIMLILGLCPIRVSSAPQIYHPYFTLLTADPLLEACRFKISNQVRSRVYRISWPSSPSTSSSLWLALWISIKLSVRSAYV